jgi:hypothetical protein
MLPLGKKCAGISRQGVSPQRFRRMNHCVLFGSFQERPRYPGVISRVVWGINGVNLGSEGWPGLAAAGLSGDIRCDGFQQGRSPKSVVITGSSMRGGGIDDRVFWIDSSGTRFRRASEGQA